MPWGLAALAQDACQSVFGTDWTVSYTPAGELAAALVPISFDPAYEQLEMQGQVAVSAIKPVLDVQFADFVTLWGAGTVPAQGDLVTIDGTDYEVTDVQPDGHGAAKLVLVEV